MSCPLACGYHRRPRGGRVSRRRAWRSRSCPRPPPAPSRPPLVLAPPFLPPHRGQSRRASPFLYRGPSSAACLHGTPLARSRPHQASSRLRRRCASRSIWIALLWPTLPLLLMLARVVAAPRFPQLLRAALDLLFAHLLFFPRNPLSLFVRPALLRHASLPLSHHSRSTAHPPRRRLPIYLARLPMSSPLLETLALLKGLLSMALRAFSFIV